MEKEKTRNFVIISHIDHGKSTLADRLLEETDSVLEKDMKEQYLDSMGLEREKGITIKMHPVRMFLNGKKRDLNFDKYLLNLIDTPGHIDFSFEISRALASVEGALLLVDATRGVQAQTLFVLQEAKKKNLKIIGAVNKIDLPSAQTEQVKEEVASLLETDKQEISEISAKTGEGVSDLIKRIVKEMPVPSSSCDSFRSLVFDSTYDSYSGVVAYIRVFDGKISKGDEFFLNSEEKKIDAKEVGIFSPNLKEKDSLKEGEIGYLKTGIKEASKVRIGETFCSSLKDEPLEKYEEPQPVLFLSLYPKDADQFSDLKKALEKLQLNDPSLSFSYESSPGLGRGLKVGFLGSLQAEIIIRRLKEEFDLDVISTAPQVEYKIETEEENLNISSPDRWPHYGDIVLIEEPWAKIEIVAPPKFVGEVFKICKNFKVKIKTTENLSSNKSLLKGEVPLRKIVDGRFYDALKSSTKGFASFGFKKKDFKEGDLRKMEVLVAKEKKETFSRIVSSQEAYSQARKMAKKLKEILPRQQFSVPIQIQVRGDIIARETIPALRKNVTEGLYGGDFTRKKKLLENQREKKKELAKKGKVDIPSEVYLKFLQN